MLEWEWKRKYKYILWLPLIILISRYDLVLLPEMMSDSAGEVFLMHYFGGSYRLESLDVSVSVMGLLGHIYLGLLFCDYYAEDIREYSGLIFTRYKRRRWIQVKTARLLGYSLLGTLLNLVIYVINAVAVSEPAISRNDILVMASAVFMLTVYTFQSIVCINILSIRYNNAIGFVLYYSLLVASTILEEYLHFYHKHLLARVLSYINPMSNFLISWNYGSARVAYGMAYFVFLSFAVVCLLWRDVKHRDLLAWQQRTGRRNG